MPGRLSSIMGLEHFKTVRDRVYREVFLNENIFAEWVTYLPYPDAKPQAVMVSIEEEEQPMLDDGDHSVVRMERIVVQCTRDKFATNRCGELISGIPSPKNRDRILRSSTRDPLQRPYVFQREILSTTEYMWRLVFSRKMQLSKSAVGAGGE